ncbi:hypothetical protein [Streptomyces sp. NPDC012825]|uniref:hypothetical protein n=1 Tax=Streptomyces sp. NPDC012825 TaxID=3364851 RepID=UPI0036B07ADC
MDANRPPYTVDAGSGREGCTDSREHREVGFRECEYEEMKPSEPFNVLSLRHVPADPESWRAAARIRLLVDGVDVVETIHPDSDSSLFHEMLIGPPETWPLRAGDEPRRVELSNDHCVTDCCGGVFVTVERCGGLVVWTWENTNDIRVPLPPDSHFDADRYDAELDRFAADRSWEEPVDTAARLLARELIALDWHRRWNCLPPPRGLGVSVGSRDEEACVTMRFRVEDSFLATAFRHYTMAVTGNEPVEDQVRRFAGRIDTSDPRSAAQPD